MTGVNELRSIFITGASTGIGRACAVYLDQLGFRVFGTVRNDDDAKNLADAGSGRLIPVMMDVTNQASIQSARDQVQEVVGEAGLYGLLNNAGFGTMTPSEVVPLDEVRRIFEVNVFGMVAVTQAMLPLLRQARGRVVNVSSMTSLLTLPFHGPYSASKAAMNAFSDAMRLELKLHGVHVCTAFPGFVITATYATNYHKARAVVGALKEARAIYGSRFKKAMAYVAGRAKVGISAEEAAVQMCRAFTDKHPRNRYPAGNDARLVLFVDPLLSGKFRDWVVMRSVGLDSDGNHTGPGL